MNAFRHRMVIRWTGTENAVWNERYPLSHDQILGLSVCDECGAQVDLLILDCDVSSREVEEALRDLRDYIAETSDCGSHSLPKTGESQPRE